MGIEAIQNKQIANLGEHIIELNIQTLQTYAGTIAVKAQEFKNDHLGLSHSDIALKMLNPVNAV